MIKTLKIFANKKDKLQVIFVDKSIGQADSYMIYPYLFPENKDFFC